ncbi:hypothetical protein ABH926_000209 [Catenulispora sp. GP43]|uniref:hypothetical protein n=1 Tax=Catenulispora sp. GP43 TaxID=3156263 RepID=UPI0035134D30
MTDLIESEDELLDPQAGPVAAAPPHRLVAALHRLRDRTPLGAGFEADPERRRRRTLAGLLALALVTGAAATGVAVHSRDVGHARARTQDRMLLHVLGGSATLTFGDLNGSGSGDGSQVGRIPGIDPLPADFTVTLRNDGAQPLEVTGIRIAVPGVAVLDPAPHMTLGPGDAEALTSKVDVNCDAGDLPQYPSGVTATVRTPAATGKAPGSPTAVPLAFDPGHPAPPASGAGAAAVNPEFLGANDVFQFQSYTTSSFYRLCGDVLATMPSRVSATALTGSPSLQNPVVSYSLHIDANSAAAQMAVPLPKPPTVPGISARTDLSAPEEIGSEGLDVNVTDRITDCAAFGDYLAVRGGASQAAAALNAATPVGLQPVDPRFRITPTPLASAAEPEFGGLTPGTADLQSTLLVQLSAVCPDM